jgi:hypothetical protein
MEATRRDGEALDILARRFKEASTTDGQVSGCDLVELVGELLEETGRAQDYTLATPRNCRLANLGIPGRVLIAYNPITEEEIPIGADDLSGLEDDEAIEDEGGERMILVFKGWSFTDALTGEEV